MEKLYALLMIKIWVRYTFTCGSFQGPLGVDWQNDWRACETLPSFLDHYKGCETVMVIRLNSKNMLSEATRKEVSFEKKANIFPKIDLIPESRISMWIHFRYLTKWNVLLCNLSGFFNINWSKNSPFDCGIIYCWCN